MVVQQDTPLTDRRRFKRRPLDRVISFACMDKNGLFDWHLGAIRDASSGGIKIRSNRAVRLERGHRLYILCIPEGSQPGYGQSAVQMDGHVAWQDKGGYYFGLEYI